ncbi:hypothetical protein ONS95_011831 [Cadophora gregata]|uniref:uncharacterized protein n=1 Tax=Cadophora gregata TaxID=51156 RepID=UPI0026DD617B|nr:uncharacterized protein ONS95_011831 [Cadophora gregata]KAK0117491.1 hypothetical protein ONS95_011831 [Cadophora gregata]KAK0122546.1 hypothetical protein ONS96_009588 [Cadophora gregata f. sp. sojae]
MMDSIALVITISTLTGVTLRTATSLDALQANFTKQERSIKSMYIECSAISVSLTKIQSCVLQDISPLNYYQLKEIFDTIITGCRVLFACLEQDIEKLADETPRSKPWKPWGTFKKFEVEWDQKKMNGYLADLRMQQGALILLNELLLIKDTGQFHKKPRDNSSTVMQQELATRQLREANPGINIPTTVYETSAPRRQTVKPGPATTYDQSFAFDNMLVNSESYRRSVGIPPSAASRNQPQPDTGPSTSSTVKQEKDELARRDAKERHSPDDEELPEYTPYPGNPNTAPVSEYIPNPRAVFQSCSPPKTVSPDRIPPLHVPDGPSSSSSLPITTTPSQLTYTIPVKNEQHILV